MFCRGSEIKQRRMNRNIQGKRVAGMETEE
jgi:hypothetical protein